MVWNLSAFADEAGPTIDQQIAALKQAGLKRIDIRGVDGFNITTLPVEHAKLVREKLDRAGITCAMYGSPIGKLDLADDSGIDQRKLQHLSRLAPVLGCTAVRIFSYYNEKAGKAPGDFRKEAIAWLKELRHAAKDLGLILYHENESRIFGDKCADVLTLAEELRDGPDGTFRMIFDFGNYNAGGENAWENWLKLRDLTDAIHLKDNLRNEDGTLYHVPAGEGGGFVQQILSDAAKRGWTGPLTVEPHLQHSNAVVATGPSGVSNQAYAAMSGTESFLVACRAAVDVIRGVGVTVN